MFKEEQNCWSTIWLWFSKLALKAVSAKLTREGDGYKGEKSVSMSLEYMLAHTSERAEFIQSKRCLSGLSTAHLEMISETIELFCVVDFQYLIVRSWN